ARVLPEMPEGRFDTRLPELDLVEVLRDHREVGMVLQYAGIDAIERGDFAEAWQTCRAQLNLGKPLREGPTLVAVTRMAHANMTIVNLERALAQGEVSEIDLATMQSALAEEAETDLVFPYWRYGRAEFVRALDEIVDGKRSLDAELKKLGNSVRLHKVVT